MPYTRDQLELFGIALSMKRGDTPFSYSEQAAKIAKSTSEADLKRIMAEQTIILSQTEWDILKDLVTLAIRAEHKLGIPLEIINGDQKIEIDSEQVKIVLIT